MVSTPIEQYALLSDGYTGALVSEAGSIDWLCFPRFDSEALFAALLGTEEHGRWRMVPRDGELVSRRYRGDTFVLDSHWRTPTGEVIITEFMPVSVAHYDEHDVVRTVRCTSGTVHIEHNLTVRFDYGASIPWIERTMIDGESVLSAIAGPSAVYLHGPRLEPDRYSHSGSFAVHDGETVSWQLVWGRSYDPPPPVANPAMLEDQTEESWLAWSEQMEVTGPYADAVRRSLLVLRALSDTRTGGIVAAATTSLPEEFGGARNWDYRFTWLRDSALTIEALISHGLTVGARAWQDWLLRAIAGDSHSLRIMYGLGGERRLPEHELEHLPGYEGSTPVRIGNAAAHQYQADVIGEVMVAMRKSREAGIDETPRSWGLQKELLDYSIANYDRKEHGIWEMRGETGYFTHSRVMMWAAFDSAIAGVDDFGLDGPVATWRQMRDRLRSDIETYGWNDEIQSYTQTYGSTEVDASLLQLPHVGYIDYTDPRMLATVAKMEADLVDDSGMLHRYRTESGRDGLPGGEYPFLICSFWLVEQYARSGRRAEAHKLMDRLVGVATPLGLLSEEYSPSHGRLAGNFPQAFSHLGLIRAADSLGTNPAASALHRVEN